MEAEGVSDGLGPRFNLDGCAGCHMQPTVGGTSPAVNPQVAVATAFGARNDRALLPEGGRAGARGADEVQARRQARRRRARALRDQRAQGFGRRRERLQDQQPDFAAASRANNLIFRIPTPVFGAGLIEQIPDSAIVANGASQQRPQGLTRHPRPSPPFTHLRPQANVNGNDGTVSRFGWKAQNQSLLLFSGEAYNVEMGISNELFQSERDERLPVRADAERYHHAGRANRSRRGERHRAVAFFMRFLAPPTPSTSLPGGAPSIANGGLTSVGCALCHTPSFTTGNSAVAALARRPVNLFSDLLLHRMGPGLADDIEQDRRDPTSSGTAPLWGLGKRLFFLHDGRTSDLLEAIQAHASGGNSRFPASEANGVVGAFNRLSEKEKQDLLNFLRSL